MDEQDRLRKRIGALNASRELLVEEAERIEAWTRVLEDHKADVPQDVDVENLGINEEKFKPEPGRARRQKIQLNSWSPTQRLKI